MDINSTCRLCMHTSDEFVCIFDEETFAMPAEVEDLFEILHLQIDSHESKPSIMCMKCYVQLSLFKKFRGICEESEKTWEEMAGPTEQHQQVIVEEVSYFDDTVIEEMEPEEEIEVTEKKVMKVRKRPKKNAKHSDLDAMERAFADKEQTDGALTEEDSKLQQFYGFYCPLCQVKLDSMTTFKYHMRLRHDEKNAVVVCCNKKLSKRYQLVDHMAYHSEPERLACQFCDKVLSDRKSLTAHIKRKHESYENRKFQCDYCQKRFVGFEPMRQHVLTHLSEESKAELRTHLCNECGMTFMHKHTLQSHINYVHLKIGLVCDLCAKHFKSKFDYALHRRNVHGEAGPAREQCPICKNWYSNEKAVREHIRYLHERTEKIRCTICDEELSSKQSLRSHTKMKHQEKMHVCTFCNKALPTAIRLKEHEAMHTGVSLYTCKYCPKEFNMKSNMYKHLKAMHPNEWMKEKGDKNNSFGGNTSSMVQEEQIEVEVVKME